MALGRVATAYRYEPKLIHTGMPLDRTFLLKITLAYRYVKPCVSVRSTLENLWHHVYLYAKPCISKCSTPVDDESNTTHVAFFMQGTNDKLNLI